MSVSSLSTAGNFTTETGFFSHLINKIARHISLVRAENQLASLDDRLLRDIGVNRDDIHRAVWGN